MKQLLLMKKASNFYGMFSAFLLLLFLQSCCLIPGFTGSCRMKPATYYASENTQSSAVTSSASAEVNKPVDMRADLTQTSIAGGSERVVELAVPGGRDKELPMGIQSITTSVLAGTNLSFKSSKEDYGSTNHKHKPGIGFQLGVASNIQFTDKFSFQPALMVKQNNASEELSYSTGGGTEPGTSFSSTSKYSYTWLSAPLLANINVTNKLSVKLGPEINYLLKATVKSEEGSSSEKENITKNSVKLGVGAQAALQYTLDKEGAWALKLLYDHRISRLNKKETEYSPGGGYEVPGWYMKSVQLSVVCAICNLMKGRK